MSADNAPTIAHKGSASPSLNGNGIYAGLMRGATRHDTGKPLVSLVPSSAILAEAEVFTFGAKKYAAHNWRKGMDYSRVLNSALRHLLAINAGEDTDKESGCLHAAHVRANMAFLIEYMASGFGTDDRHNKDTSCCTTAPTA